MKRKNDMGLSNYDFHNVNPFINDVALEIQSKKQRLSKKVAGYKFQDVVDVDTGEVRQQTMLVLGERKMVDNAEFVKIYKGQLHSFYGLSKSSLELIDYIMEILKYGEDKVFLFIPDIMGSKDISYSSIYRSISQLIEKNLLAKASKVGLYFINPQIMFKGDRLLVVNEYIKEEAKNKPIKKSKSLTDKKQ